MDADALLFRPPAALAAMNPLPTALSDTWAKKAQPKTTVPAGYAGLKAKRGVRGPAKHLPYGLGAVQDGRFPEVAALETGRSLTVC
jgi:hypothetical protein